MTVQRLTQRLLKLFRPAPSSQEERWKSGIHEEVEFWDAYLASRGAAWGGDFAERTDPAFPLQEYLAEVISVPAGAPVRILDVGAGPLTYVGKSSDRWPISIVAVDPLAAEYDSLLARHAIVPPVRTVRGDAERLSELFPANSFELVSARNCIDHSYNPLLAIRQMLAVVKPGCPVFMHHAMNEAVRQNWVGLHQWNFGDEGGHFILGSRDGRTDVSAALRDEATVTNKTYGDEWIVTTIAKRKG